MQKLLVKAINRTEAFKLCPWARWIFPVYDPSDDLTEKSFICFDSDSEAQNYSKNKEKLWQLVR